MKLTHRIITTLGIVTLVGGVTDAVSAQPAYNESSTLIAQINHRGLYNQPFGGLYHGNLDNYRAGIGYYQGSFYNPAIGGFYQGSFYNYNPILGGLNQGSFYNPGFSGLRPGSFFNPSAGGLAPGSFYNSGNFGRSYPGSYNPCLGLPAPYARSLGCLNQQDYRTAVENYTQVIRRNPKVADNYNKRALARFVLGDKQGTIQDLKQAANLYLNQGNQKKYQQTLETIREIQSDRAIDSTK